MSRIRSPAHPDVPLQRAIELASKLHERVRSNPVDRETCVKEMGYSGMTGASGKMLANLLHYGLVGKAGKGAVRVTPLAVDIMHPKAPDDRRRALYQAGNSPAFFQGIRREFSDGIPTETWLRSYMVRQGFSGAAIGGALSSYLETCRYLQQEGAYESHGAPTPPPVDSAEIDELDGADEVETESVIQTAPKTASQPLRREAAPQPAPANERTVFTEEGTTGQYLKLLASGEIDDYMLEALEDYVKRQRRRLQQRQEPN